MIAGHSCWNWATPRILEALPTAGEDNQKPLDDPLALFRTGVRRVTKKFLAPPEVLVRMMGAVASQRMLEQEFVGEPMFRVRWVAADVLGGVRFACLRTLARVGTFVRQCPVTAVERCLFGATARNSLQRPGATAPTGTHGIRGPEKKLRTR